MSLLSVRILVIYMFLYCHLNDFEHYLALYNFIGYAAVLVNDASLLIFNPIPLTKIALDLYSLKIMTTIHITICCISSVRRVSVLSHCHW